MKFSKQEELNGAFTAGQNAFLIGTDLSNNPYQGAAKASWAKGFIEKSRKYPAKDRLPYGTVALEKPFKGRFTRGDY